MKHKLFPMVAFCALTFSLVAKADEVKSKVKFGARPSCSGIGFCKITTTTTTNIIAKESGEVPATFTWDGASSHLTMQLPAKSLEETPAEVLSGLKAGKFVVEEAFPLSKEMIKGLKAPQNLTIAAGTYPARKQPDGSIIIDFGKYDI